MASPRPLHPPPAPKHVQPDRPLLEEACTTVFPDYAADLSNANLIAHGLNPFPPGDPQGAPYAALKPINHEFVSFTLVSGAAAQRSAWVLHERGSARLSAHSALQRAAHDSWLAAHADWPGLWVPGQRQEL